jgi:hypothetical protein
LFTQQAFLHEHSSNFAGTILALGSLVNQPYSREMAESSASEEQDDLVERLYNHLSTSEFDNNSRKFMPEGVLDCIIKRKSILEAMDIENPNADDDQLVKFILENATKIFATSVSIKLKLLQRAMLLFKENNIHDGKLPFDDTPDSILASLEPSVGRHRQKKIWTPSTIHNFCSDQWKFLTPVFSTDSKTDIDKYDLPISTIIPFIEKHADFEKGSFGKVSKYEIHPNHIKDPLRPVRQDRGGSLNYEVVPDFDRGSRVLQSLP